MVSGHCCHRHSFDLLSLSTLDARQYPHSMLGFASVLILQTFEDSDTGERFMQVRSGSVWTFAVACVV